MAIWIWIIAAWVLSYLALGKKKTSFEHLIWILLPVDMYGITMAGATIKPYMIFCFFLFIRLLLQRREKTVLNGWVYMSGFICGAVVLVNLINNRTSSAPKAALLLLIVWGCVVLYLLNCGKSTPTDIPNVMIATGIGYGIIFIVGYVVMKMGLNLPGVLASTRYDDGFFMTTSNMYDGSLILSHRLRGFFIDPNTMIGTFAFCSICCIIRIINGRGRIREWMGLIISGCCVLMSNSRMGIICFMILAVLTFILCYHLANVKVRNVIKLSSILLIGIIVVTLIGSDYLQGIVSDIVASYDNRSGLNDKYGRFTIWRNAISVLFSHNPLLGTGIGQMRYYTSTGKDCHNTWLAMICNNGLIVGGILVLHFIYAAFIGIERARKNTDEFQNELLWALAIGTLIVMVSLISVDNITYSYLWFATALMCARSCNEENKLCMQAK